MGIDEGFIRWLFSYLMNRKQSIRDKNGRPTGYRPEALGIPLGSILGPLLFGLFIRNLPAVLRHSSCRIYADDTQLYNFYVSDINAAIARVQMDAQTVVDWDARMALS